MPEGKVLDMGNRIMHYNWIAQNFAKLFPDRTFSDKEVFAAPYEEGWIHIRNQFRGNFTTVSLSGSKEAIDRNRHVLGDIVGESWAIHNAEVSQRSDSSFYVDISFHDRHRDTYKMPEDYDKLKHIISV
jgi:hypothetical protein